MKASKADDWDRKYHKALLKEQEPIWVAAGVSVELAPGRCRFRKV
jgi:hypothetical protein